MAPMNTSDFLATSPAALSLSDLPLVDDGRLVRTCAKGFFLLVEEDVRRDRDGDDVREVDRDSELVEVGV